MKIVISAREIEEAVIKMLNEEKGITVKFENIKWTEGCIVHPIYPIQIELK